MDFNNKVWNACKKIPKGKVSTYKLIGDAIGTKAYRAIGYALSKNPYAPNVPCHRVVCSNGKIGGFNGKKFDKRKIELLKKEKILIKNKKIENFEKIKYNF